MRVSDGDRRAHNSRQDVHDCRELVADRIVIHGFQTRITDDTRAPDASFGRPCYAIS